MFRDVADRFMSQILDLEPGNYLIADESSLTDRVGMDDLELTHVSRKIQELYGLDVSDVEGSNLLQIFVRIAAMNSD